MAAAPKTRANPGQNRPPAAPIAELPARNAEARIQLGARIPEAKYRQLKLAAVLRGVTVQILIEQAIQEFLTNRPESLRVFGCLAGAGAGECPEAGVRKASKEESAGCFAPAVVSVYGDLTRGSESLCWLSDGDAGRVSGARVILVCLGAVGRVVSRCGIWVFAREGGASGCRRLSVGITGEIPASDRRSGRG